jgi:anthranilate synthase component 1
MMRLEIPFDPLGVYSGIKESFDGDSFLLESVEGGRARYSFIGFDPIFVFKSKGDEVEINGKKTKVENPYEELRHFFSRFKPVKGGKIPLSSGLVGYFSYDIVRFFEELPTSLPDNPSFPDAHFILPSHILCFDGIEHETFLSSYDSHDRGREEIEEIVTGLEPIPFSVSEIKPNMSKDHFEDGVIKAKEYIREGDIFQVVLSRRLSGDYSGDPLQFYSFLRRINPSPYMFHLDFGETKIIGSSPETLVRLRDGKITLRPIAGTRRRGNDVEEDERLKLEMILDEKERAEHLMLIDLGRNDLGRVSTYGSVKVNELMNIEKYSHVQHMVSNVVGRLAEGKDAFDVFKAAFPAGTVSGAPKIRAMEIIEELEKDRRGPYAGAVGYFDFSGNMDLAITIRSMFTHGKKAYFQAGSGIVTDSIPEREFEETEEKLRAFMTRER